MTIQADIRSSAAAEPPARPATPAGPKADVSGNALADAPAQPLAGARVLLDAHNLDMEEGTGIATYARTLGAALKHLGAATSYLYARPVAARDPLVREAEFYDARAVRPQGRIGAALARFRRLRQVFLDGSFQADAMPARRTVVVEPERIPEGTLYNAPDLYDLAVARSMLGRGPTRVRLPDRVDIAHLTYPTPIEVEGAKHVLTIHDLIPIRLPYTTLDNKAEMVRRLRALSAKADLILTVSESSKRDIVEILDVDPARIEVTYQPTDIEPLRPSETNALRFVLGRLGLEPQRYSLFVGAIEPKKNLRRLLPAYLEADTGLPLVVVGKRAWMWDKEIGQTLARLQGAKSPRIIFLDYVSRRDLRFLYAGAVSFLFPSLYEGFGLPVLEAMRFGVPILTSKTSSLPEVAGEAALYVNPFDPVDIRMKIERLNGDQKLRNWLSERALEQAAEFSHEKYVEKLGRAYSRLL